MKQITINVWDNELKKYKKAFEQYIDEHFVIHHNLLCDTDSFELRLNGNLVFKQKSKRVDFTIFPNNFSFYLD